MRNQSILWLFLIVNMIPYLTYGQSNIVSVPIVKYEACIEEYETLQADVQENGSLDDESLIDAYLQCHYAQGGHFNDLTKQGNGFIQEEQYQDALSTFQEARTIVIDTTAVDQVIIDLAIALAEEAYKNGERANMNDRLEYAQSFPVTERRDNYLIWYLYSLNELQDANRKEANVLAKKARSYADSREDIEQIGSLTAYINERLLAPSSDQLSYRQFWLSKLHIDDVRDKIDADTDDIVVAVIDSGIDIYHPDLQGQIWENSDEIPDNGKDDDNNGFIDDTHGYDFYENTGNITTTDGHGTLVAGVIGALQNNNVGISGIVPHVKILPVVVCQNDECLPGSQLAKAIEYAVNNGADIINMSISSTKSSTSNDKLNAAVSYANQHNVPIVVAAGNGIENDEGVKVPIDTAKNSISPVCNEPSSKKQIVGVGATNSNSQKLSRSNIGPCVDVRAYGEGIVSTSFFGASDGKYGIAEGTSLAAPMIAGIIGLGHLIHGKQHRKNIYDSLEASLNSRDIPEADVYIRELGKRSISDTKQIQIENVALYINQLIESSSPAEQIELTTKLRSLLSTYEEQLAKKNSYTNLTILYELARALNEFDAFDNL